ncbi:spindle assembly abnormal protein 6 homolog [Corythoichthys intestinalis]|uniref:spindle assembly abnormal protein 6 homolog n=1 Tax=Corythoichthys intestinalis TaxID=161448 RepID=UPI0025A525D8|nr:spindle assembly abnormal protein 6 homolog [Corythoichthys intestinalis]
MAPKRPPPAQSYSEPKKKRKMMTVHEKVQLLDMLNVGHSYSALQTDTKRVVTPRNNTIVKMENALTVWISDCREKKVSLDGKRRREEEEEVVEEEEEKEEEEEEALVRKNAGETANMSTRQQTSTEQLFSKVVEVTISRGGNERSEHLRITVAHESSKSTVDKHDLVVRLTKDTDPRFLVLLVLSDADFQSLKKEQGLVTDFRSFPELLIELLQKCHSEQNSSLSRFQLLLSFIQPKCPFLSVMKTNLLRKVEELRLRVTEASDKDVIDYMADCLSLLKKEKESLEMELQTVKGDLYNTKQMLAEKSKELERQCLDWRSSHADELRTERAMSAKAQKSLELQIQQMQQQFQEQETTHKSTLDRIELLEANCSSLLDIKQKNEAAISDLTSKLEEERQCAKRDTASLKHEIASLNTALDNKEHLFKRLVQDKEQQTKQSKEMLKEMIESKDALVKKLNSEVAFLSADVKKGNDIIRKFQDDVRVLREKNSIKKEALEAQEEVVKDTSAKLRSTREEVRAKDEQIANLKEQLDASLQKLAESKELLQTNNNLINFLNKQLNEKQLIERFPEPSENLSAGPRAHYHHQAMKVAATEDPIHKRAMSYSAGLDEKYFTKQENNIPVSSFPAAFVPKECPPAPRSKPPVPSAYFAC